MSEREAIISRFSEFISENRLDEGIGIDSGIRPTASGKGKYRFITFTRPRTLDGQISVYGKTYIVIAWQGAVESLPHEGSEKFTSETAALAFMKEHFAT